MEQRGTGDESREEECEKLSNWASQTSQPTPVPHRALESVVPGLLHILQVAFTLACSAVHSAVLRGSRLLPSSSPGPHAGTCEHRRVRRGNPTWATQRAHTVRSAGLLTWKRSLYVEGQD